MSSPFQSRDVREDRELADFVEFVTEVPRRITAIEVSGPRTTESLIETLRNSSPLLVEELFLSPPNELAGQIRSLATKPAIVAVRGLDSAADFPEEAAAIAFWQELNYHREYLTPGELRTCFFLSPTNYRRMAVHADDLRSWARTYSFADHADEAIVTTVTSAPADVSGDTLPLDVLRGQLLRARAARMSERAIVRDFALPLFSAAVKSEQVTEALHVWHEYLDDGAALVELSAEERANALIDRSILAYRVGDSSAAMKHVLQAIENLPTSSRTSSEYRAFESLGRYAMARGEGERAEAALKKALVAAENIAGVIGERERAIANVETDLGILCAYRGDLSNAISHYESARSRFIRVKQSASDRRADSLLAWTLENLAMAYWKRNDFAAAARAAGSSLRLRLTASSDPLDLAIRRGVADSHGLLAVIYSDMGDNERASEELAAAASIYEPLVKTEPLNASLQYELASVYGKLGLIEQGKQNRQAALRSYRHARDMLQPLVASDSGKVQYARLLQLAEDSIASLAEDHGSKP